MGSALTQGKSSSFAPPKKAASLRMTIQLRGLTQRRGLYTEAFFHAADTVAGDRELGVLRVLEREDDSASEPRVDLVNPVGVDESGSVYAQKLGGVETAFQLDDGLMYAVPASVDYGVGELVVCNEMSHVIERQK